MTETKRIKTTTTIENTDIFSHIPTAFIPMYTTIEQSKKYNNWDAHTGSPNQEENTAPPPLINPAILTRTENPIMAKAPQDRYFPTFPLKSSFSNIVINWPPPLLRLNSAIM